MADLARAANALDERPLTSSRSLEVNVSALARPPSSESETSVALRTIYTVGHSGRSLGELIVLLGAVEMRELVDVRSAPRSRRRPYFAADALSRALTTSHIAYRHERALGGHHYPRQQSPNGAWQRRAFRGYADYMNSDGFRVALAHLQERASQRATCLLCAEANWRRCHRRLICDALLIRGWRVLHLGLQEKPLHHVLTPFAVIADDHTITYPPLQEGDRAGDWPRSATRSTVTQA